ncbi:UNVERIFIED_CONTAM: hypothetical protein Slati_0672000 [Sesamum latifolium]|uniref:Uncharacterized protein n=1 Tax=Sesamum latifolium TaxID=2727402 RepID=A0AAW2Y428_9LAMI
MGLGWVPLYAPYLPSLILWFIDFQFNLVSPSPSVSPRSSPNGKPTPIQYKIQETTGHLSALRHQQWPSFCLVSTEPPSSASHSAASPPPPLSATLHPRPHPKPFQPHHQNPQTQTHAPEPH